MFTVRSTQPGHPSVGRRNEYQPKGSDALQCGWGVKTDRPMVCVWVAGKTVWGPGKSFAVYSGQDSGNPTVHLGGDWTHWGSSPSRDV